MINGVERPTGGAWPQHTTLQQRSTHQAQNNTHACMHTPLQCDKKPPSLAYVADALQFARLLLPPFPSSWLSRPLQHSTAPRSKSPPVQTSCFSSTTRLPVWRAHFFKSISHLSKKVSDCLTHDLRLRVSIPSRGEGEKKTQKKKKTEEAAINSGHATVITEGQWFAQAPPPPSLPTPYVRYAHCVSSGSEGKEIINWELLMNNLPI